MVPERQEQGMIDGELGCRILDFGLWKVDRSGRDARRSDLAGQECCQTMGGCARNGGSRRWGGWEGWFSVGSCGKIGGLWC